MGECVVDGCQEGGAGLLEMLFCGADLMIGIGCN